MARRKKALVPNKDYGPSKIGDVKKQLGARKRGKYKIGDKGGAPGPPAWSDPNG